MLYAYLEHSRFDYLSAYYGELLTRYELMAKGLQKQYKLRHIYPSDQIIKYSYRYSEAMGRYLMLGRPPLFPVLIHGYRL